MVLLLTQILSLSNTPNVTHKNHFDPSKWVTFIKVSSWDKKAIHKVFWYCCLLVTGSVQDSSVSLLDVPFLESLGDMILQIDPKHFFPSDSTDYNSVIKCFCELLHSPIIPLQLTAYHTLTRWVTVLKFHLCYSYRVMLEACQEFYHLSLGLYIYLKSRMMHESASLFSHICILFVHMYVLLKIWGKGWNSTDATK